VSCIFDATGSQKAAVERFWRVLAVCEIEIVPFDEAQARVAAAAFGQLR